VTDRRLTAAKLEEPEWYAAACLAGEAGLRSGEIKALRWREDVDLIAKTITVNQQTCYGETTTPKDSVCVVPGLEWIQFRTYSRAGSTRSRTDGWTVAMGRHDSRPPMGNVPRS
jgi:hypothetical protein